MAEDKITATCEPDTAPKSGARRRSELIRRFADQFTKVPAEITPKWQRAIDTYNRVKSEQIKD